MLSLRETRYRNAGLLSLRGVGVAGSFAALSVALLYCRVPHAAPQSLAARTLLLLALKYVFTTTTAGLAITWLYFQTSTSQPGPVFQILACNLSFAWLLFPAFVLFLWENSPLLLLVAPAAAVAMAFSLDRFPPTTTEPEPEPQNILFAEPPPLPPRRYAVIASLCIYAAAFAGANIEVDLAGPCLAIAAFLLATKWSSTSKSTAANYAQTHQNSPRVLRLASALLFSLVLTFVALLPWMRTSSRLVIGTVPNTQAKNHPKPGSPGSRPVDTWHAIILWPYPPQEDRIPPIPRSISYRSGTTLAPLVIPFHGSYQYFRTPGDRIAEHAHTAQGTPLALDIHSSDWEPLFEDARQTLATPVDLACCRAIQVVVRNADNRRGGMVLGLILSDSSHQAAISVEPDRFQTHLHPSEDGAAHSLSLTPQPILTSFPVAFTMKPSPVTETLTFAIPPQPRLQRFDEISVVFLPEPQRASLGAKIAIQQFNLIPH